MTFLPDKLNAKSLFDSFNHFYVEHNTIQIISGNKFVIKQVSGVRKQFLILNGEAILGFVTKGKKFASCSSYTEITANVDCKVGGS